MNPRQEELIRSIDGIHVVDAGPGTGKTHTITRRYISILSTRSDIGPEDVLLLTFTNNAAENMRDRIVNALISSRPDVNVLETRISTFHSFCRQILMQGAEHSPRYLGVGERLTRDFDLLENRLLEEDQFDAAYRSFRRERPEYRELYPLIGGRSGELLRVIRQLLSKGVFPTAEGWFLEGEKVIRGDRQAFLSLVAKTNRPGSRQSEMLRRFKSLQNGKVYLDMPNIDKGKALPDEAIAEAFDADRSEVMDLVHDLYLHFIRHAVREGRITFDFLTMFAFLVLYHDAAARRRNSFRYVMVDEFQDTNEMQFLLSMLLLKEPNLCVVGDWKQGIYGFRHATIENITDFEGKLRRYRDLLNSGEERVPFDLTSHPLEFVSNYRSHQRILDLAKWALKAPGKKEEEVDHQAIDSRYTDLTAERDLGERCDIGFIRAESREGEIDSILAKVQDIVSSGLEVVDGPTVRGASFRDIALLTRTRDFGLRIQERALELGIPVRYDGGVELFRTRQALLALAWLRLLADVNDVRGWVALLDDRRLPLSEKERVLDSKEYPQDLLVMRRSLAGERRVVPLLTSIFSFHRIDDAFSGRVIHELARITDVESMSLPRMISFMERNIEEGITYEMSLSDEEDAVTIQTLHGAKGLEYPVVFVVNCNQGQFPSSRGDSGLVLFDPVLGLRCTKRYVERDGHLGVLDEWKTDLVRSAVSTDYDEERRLLYVGMTRAKQYLYLTCHRPSTFYASLAAGSEGTVPGEPRTEEHPSPVAMEAIPRCSHASRRKALTVHDIMSTRPSGQGREFGDLVHDQAERAALGLEVIDLEEVHRIERLLSAFAGGRLMPEADCALPLGDVLIRGRIDLLVEFDDRLRIIDYKTDLDLTNHQEYVKQLSVYHHAAERHFDKPASSAIHYVSMDRLVEVEPLSMDDLILEVNKVI